MKHHPLVAALHMLVSKAQGPMDRRLKKLAGGAHQIPEQDDEGELHKAIQDELGVDGRPRSMEAAAAEEGDMPPANHNPAITEETPPEPKPSPADMPKKRHGVRF